MSVEEQPGLAGKRTSNRLRLVVGGFCLFGLVLLGVLLLQWETGSYYGGRSLEDWVQVYCRFDENSPDAQAQEAKAAISIIANRELPKLVEQVAYDPSPRRQRAVAWGRRVPKWLRHPVIMKPLLVDEDEARTELAGTALRVLGASGRPALPELTKLALESPSPVVTRRALWAMGRIGPEALPVVTAAITNVNHPSRAYALDCLVDYGTNAKPLVPVLRQLENDPNSLIRERASSALARLAVQP
jgi:HEAT repeat protein